MSTFYIKTGDTKPALTATLVDSGGTAVNLTSATVQLIYRPIGTGVAATTRTMTITSASAGTVSYTWVAGDTSTAKQCEYVIKVTFADASVQTFPGEGVARFTVQAQVA